ncbi:MAG: signal peptidase II [Clostridiales bacterium]|nr:signal peptidase II [Clostridiales bacterium]
MKKTVHLVLWSVLLIAFDQWTKYLAQNGLDKPIPLIRGVFELQYVENQGAAFGILQNKLWLFIIFTLIMLTVLGYLYYKTPAEKSFGWIRLALILIISGAIGNLIDRVLRRYVVDFLYFKLIDFPVFNVADSFVVVGCCLFVLLYFVQKQQVSEVMSNLEKKEKASE